MKKLLFVLGCMVTSTLLAQEKDLLFVFLNKRTDLPEMPKEQVDKLMEGHLANIEKLAKEGKLVVAGPFDGGGGIFVLKTKSVEEARQWLSTDPGVQAKRWNVEYLPVAFRIGGACPVGEKYEMTSYHFIRYGLNLTKFNVQDSPNTLRRHEQYMKQLAQTGNVIAEASFGDREGAILIMKGDLDERVVEASPAVQEQLFEVEIKNLWVAKGSFCEGK
jgi:uncharacterized protein YciI